MNQAVARTVKDLNIDEVIITYLKLDKATKRLSAGIYDTKNKCPLHLQTPWLITPFGPSYFDGGNKNLAEETKAWGLDLKAQGVRDENVDDVVLFFKFLRELDEKVIDYCIVNSQSIFKKKYDETQRQLVKDAFYGSGVKSSMAPDGTPYPDKFKGKLNRTQETLIPDLLLYKSNSNGDVDKLEINSYEELQALLPKGGGCRGIIQPKVYFVNSKAGTNFKICQLQLENKVKLGKLTTYAFSDAPVINKLNNLETVKIEEETHTPEETRVPEESDDESEADSEVEVDDC